jgi:hypothetical protein
LEINKLKYPYEILQEANHVIELQRTDQYTKEDFHDTLTNKDICNGDYEEYVKEAMQHVNRLAYLLYCNERDVEIMPQIIDLLINLYRKFDVDMLRKFL